jgi:hypothetical protein
MCSTKAETLGRIPSATGGIARLACARLRQEGKDVASVLLRAGVSLEEADDPTIRLEARTQIKVLQFAADELHDDLLGFHLACSLSKVPVEIGRNHAFLQQFWRRGIPRELHERDREQVAKFLGIPADDLRGPDNPRPSSHDNGADDRPQVQPAPEGTVRELITRRLGEMGLSIKDASLSIGRNETYVRQFLMRGSPAELRRVARLSESRFWQTVDLPRVIPLVAKQLFLQLS